MIKIAELEMSSIRWNTYRELAGEASNIRSSLTRLLSSGETDGVKEAYWGLENHVVVDGIVYSSAEPTVCVLMASFLDPHIPQVRVAALNLIYQILTGSQHPDELESGQSGLIERCRQRVREGMWPLMREALIGSGEAALDVIELVDQARADEVRSWFGDQPIPGAWP